MMDVSSGLRLFCSDLLGSLLGAIVLVPHLLDPHVAGFHRAFDAAQNGHALPDLCLHHRVSTRVGRRASRARAAAGGEDGPGEEFGAA